MASNFKGNVDAENLVVTGSAKFNGAIQNAQSTRGVYIGVSTGNDPQIQLQGAGETSPHIDFCNGTEDYDVRLILTGDNQLSVYGGDLALDNNSISNVNNMYARRYYDNDNSTYYMDPAGTSYLNQIDGVNWKAKHLTTVGLGNSYDERVILLCPKIDTNTSLDNHVHGKIMLRKTGGNVVDFFDVYVNCVYNDNRAVMHSMGQRNNHKFVTCSYNGITWVAIKVGYTANPYNEAWFQGFADTSYSAQAKADQLKVISYYDNNGGGALNAEIYATILDYTPNGLAFKSTASSNNFDGPITSAADITAYSDARLKSDVVTIEGALDKVSALRGVDYIKDGKPSTGVIAQEVEAVKPELVHTADDDMGTKSVAYGNMAGMFIEAIKELKERVEALEKENAELRNK